MSAEYNEIPSERLEVYIKNAADTANAALDSVYEQEKVFMPTEAKDILALYNAGLGDSVANGAKEFLEDVDFNTDSDVVNYMLSKAPTLEERRAVIDSYHEDPRAFIEQAILKYHQDAFALQKPVEKHLPVTQKKRWLPLIAAPREDNSN
jgi:hypothetical protein